jgi:hypothetical protein
MDTVKPPSLHGDIGTLRPASAGAAITDLLRTLVDSPAWFPSMQGGEPGLPQSDGISVSHPFLMGCLRMPLDSKASGLG